MTVTATSTTTDQGDVERRRRRRRRRSSCRPPTPPTAPTPSPPSAPTPASARPRSPCWRRPTTTVRDRHVHARPSASLGGAGGDAQAQSSGLTEARVGPAFGVTPPATARRIVVTGDLSIRAEINQTVMADTARGHRRRRRDRCHHRALVRRRLDAGLHRQRHHRPGRHADDRRQRHRRRDGVRSATANSTVGSVAGRRRAGSNSTSGVRGSLDAFIGSGARVTVVAAAAVSVGRYGDGDGRCPRRRRRRASPSRLLRHRDRRPDRCRSDRHPGLDRGRCHPDRRQPARHGDRRRHGHGDPARRRHLPARLGLRWQRHRPRRLRRRGDHRIAQTATPAPSSP